MTGQLDTLEKKLEPAHTALVVIDVLNDFCAPDGAMAREGFPVESAQAMAERVPALAAAAREAGALVVFVRNVYSTEPNLYLSDVWLEQATRRRSGSYTVRPVCVPGSVGADFYGGVRPGPEDAVVVKHRFNAFIGTDLDVVLRARRIRTLVFAGVATNVCIESTVRHAFLTDHYVVVAHDVTAAYSETEHEASLSTIDRYFGEVRSSEEIAACWRS